MSPVPEKASAVTVSHTTWSLMSFPVVYFPLKWRGPMTAPLLNLWKSSPIKPEVAEEANLSYIISDEQEKKSGCPQA